jgi:hypothetical protein
MAKLTIFFKNNVVRSYLFDGGRVHIGRDESNDVLIASPEFAPVYAVIVTRGDRCMIKQLNEEFPLMLNGKNTKEGRLQHGDKITAGYYDIVYSIDDAGQPNNSTTINHNKTNYVSHTANFQVISGTNIGKIFYLNTPMTMIGEHGRGMVAISKRKDGYFASTLEGTGIITLNNQVLDDKIIKLNHHDVLVVNNTTVQFYFPS